MFQVDTRDDYCSQVCQILYNLGRLHTKIHVFETLWTISNKWVLDSV